MCDYSITAKKQLKAAKGQNVVTAKFNMYSSTGFAPKDGDGDTAVCLLPGTELAFKRDVIVNDENLGAAARFRQLNKDKEGVYHDHLEFANGKVVTLGHLDVGIEATVLQLPLAETLGDSDEAGGVAREGQRAPAPEREPA